MDNQKIQAQYELYKRKRAEKQAEQTAEQQAKAARLEAIRAALAPRTVKVAKPHTCNNCKGTIQKGETATVENVITGWGWPEGNHYYTHYYCGSCRPTQEA